MTIRPEILLIAGAVVIGAIVVTGKNAGAVGASAGAAAVDLVDGVVTGGVLAIGDKLGLPDTRAPTIVEQGRAELAAGDLWNASVHLPAGEFLAGAWERVFN